MECKTNQAKLRKYQGQRYLLFGSNVFFFVMGCVSMVRGWVPEAIRGLMAIALVILVACLIPSFLLLVNGLAISGTQRVFLVDDTLLYCTWDGDNGVGGAKHRMYKIWKVTDYQVKKDQIDVVAFAWHAEAVMDRDGLPVVDGQLGDISALFEKAERGRREFAIRRTLDHEDQILAMLELRKHEAAPYGVFEA